MPVLGALLRRKGRSSDMDIRRHSFYTADSRSNPNVADGRASEQIPRRPSAAEFLSPETATKATASVPGEPATPTRDLVETADAQDANRSVSPPVQEEIPKHRRFSMMKFRHASDSQLNTRARLQSHHAPAPPMPKRESPQAPTIPQGTSSDREQCVTSRPIHETNIFCFQLQK